MKRFSNARGGASVGMLVTLLVILFLGYEAMQFGPHIISQFQFQDAVMEAAKFSRNKPALTVQEEVLKKAEELGLPISRDMIKVTRQNTKTRIQVHYVLEAEWLPGRPYKWNVDVDEESILF